MAHFENAYVAKLGNCKHTDATRTHAHTPSFFFIESKAKWCMNTRQFTPFFFSECNLVIAWRLYFAHLLLHLSAPCCFFVLCVFFFFVFKLNAGMRWIRSLSLSSLFNPWMLYARWHLLHHLSAKQTQLSSTTYRVYTLPFHTLVLLMCAAGATEVRHCAARCFWEITTRHPDTPTPTVGIIPPQPIHPHRSHWVLAHLSLNDYTVNDTLSVEG